MIDIPAHLLLTSAWVLWCVLHSLLIATWWMQLMNRLLGSRIAYYRLFYVFISVATIIPVFFLQFHIYSPILWFIPLPLVILRWLGVVIALLLFWKAARQYDQPFFFGLRQIREHRAGAEAEFSGFVASGILERMRHPYYSAGILLLLCWGDITAANLIFKTIGIAYFLIGATLEERKLVSAYGEEYRRYQREVPMFIPKLRR